MAKKKSTTVKKTQRERKPKPEPKLQIGDNEATLGDELSDEERQQLFLNHRERWNQLSAKRKALDAQFDTLKGDLKNDGFTIKMMKIADSLADVQGEAKIRAEVDERLRVARWIGHPLGAQLDLFEQPDRTPLVDRAFEAGKIASMENKPAKPPHSPETEPYRAWMDGYHSHQRELAGGLKAPETRPETETAH